MIVIATLMWLGSPTSADIISGSPRNDQKCVASGSPYAELDVTLMIQSRTVVKESELTPHDLGEPAANSDASKDSLFGSPREAMIRKTVQDMARDLGIGTQEQAKDAPCPHSAHMGSSKAFAVAYEVRNSPIEGVGVFLREPVKRGQLIWTFMPEKNMILFPEDAPLLRDVFKNANPQVVRRLVSDWFYQFPEYCGNCSIIELDDDRYINDGGSNHSNLVEQGMFSVVAKSDLEAGTELLEDYGLDDIDGCPVWWDDLCESIGFGDVALLRKNMRLGRFARLSHMHKRNEVGDVSVLRELPLQRRKATTELITASSPSTNPNSIMSQPKQAVVLQREGLASSANTRPWLAMCAWVAVEYIYGEFESHVMGFRNLKIVAGLFVTQCLIILATRIVFAEFQLPVCLLCYFSGTQCVRCIDDLFFRKIPIWWSESLLYSIHASIAALAFMVFPMTPNIGEPCFSGSAAHTVVNFTIGLAIALSLLGVYILNHVNLHRQHNMRLTCLVKWSAPLLYVWFECVSTLLLIDAALPGSTQSAPVCSLALIAATVASVVFEETMEKQWVHVCANVITEHVFLLALMYLYTEYPKGFLQYLLLASSLLMSICRKVMDDTDWVSWKYQSAVTSLDPLEKRLEAIRVKICSAQCDIANHKTLVVIGTGAVGQLVLNRLPSALGQHASNHHCIVIDVKEAHEVISALPSECSYLQFKFESTAESFSLVMDHLGLRPGDFVVELAHGISTMELARWCRARGLHMVNAQIAEDVELELVLDLDEQVSNLEDGVLAEFKDGPTHVYAHGMNPGLVSYAAKIALRDLGCRLGVKCNEITCSKGGGMIDLRRAGEHERMVLNRIANQIKVHRVDITEQDTQEHAQDLSAASFVSTWSPAAFHEEVSQCEAVRTYGDGVKRLGKYSIDTSQRSITGAPTIKTFEGFIVAHEECFTLRSIFRSTLPVQIQFVYQPSPQMRRSLLRARRVEDLDDAQAKTHVMGDAQAKTHVMGKDTEPGGFDSVGALVLAKEGHAQWCGLCLNIEETREHFRSFASSTSEAQPDSEGTLNATSWLTAVGVLMAVSVCIEYPNAGALLAEDIPFSVVDLAISKRIIPPFISQSISSEVWTSE